MKDRISTEDKLEMGLGFVIIFVFMLAVGYIFYSTSHKKPVDKIEVVYGGSNVPVDTSLDAYQHFLESNGYLNDTSFLGTAYPGQTERDSNRKELVGDTGYADGSAYYYIPNWKVIDRSSTIDYKRCGDTMILNPDVFHYIKIGNDVYKITKNITIKMVKPITMELDGTGYWSDGIGKQLIDNSTKNHYHILLTPIGKQLLETGHSSTPY